MLGCLANLKSQLHFVASKAVGLAREKLLAALPSIMVLGKAPELSETRQYLADSNLMPALEAGIAEMLKATQGEGSRQDGVNYLAQCMRALSLSCSAKRLNFLLFLTSAPLSKLSPCAQG